MVQRASWRRLLQSQGPRRIPVLTSQKSSGMPAVTTSIRDLLRPSMFTSRFCWWCIVNGIVTIILYDPGQGTTIRNKGLDVDDVGRRVNLWRD
jgi:hypothetical protein